ncbi:MAG: shikimate dehydrogenase family protein, partial [Thermoplasmata archaeon]
MKNNPIVTGLIGMPVVHSIGQIVFNRIYEAEGINAVYIAIEVMKGNLENFVRKSAFMKGYNVTIPHKVSIMDLLDHIDATASRVGSVNLVVNYEGFNTDYSGFDLTVERNGIDFNGKKILIAGTGGIFRTVYRYIRENSQNAEITIKSRDPQSSRMKIAGIIEGEDIIKKGNGCHDILIN